jgi:hypothetical protein
VSCVAAQESASGTIPIEWGVFTRIEVLWFDRRPSRLPESVDRRSTETKIRDVPAAHERRDLDPAIRQTISAALLPLQRIGDTARHSDAEAPVDYKSNSVHKFSGGNRTVNHGRPQSSFVGRGPGAAFLKAHAAGGHKHSPIHH